VKKEELRTKRKN